MDPTQIAPLVVSILTAAVDAKRLWTDTRDAATSSDRGQVEALLAELSAESNSAADTLRNTPDDAE